MSVGGFSNQNYRSVHLEKKRKNSYENLKQNVITLLVLYFEVSKLFGLSWDKINHQLSSYNKVTILSGCHDIRICNLYLKK